MIIVKGRIFSWFHSVKSATESFKTLKSSLIDISSFYFKFFPILMIYEWNCTPFHSDSTCFNGNNSISPTIRWSLNSIFRNHFNLHLKNLGASLSLRSYCIISSNMGFASPDLPNFRKFCCSLSVKNLISKDLDMIGRVSFPKLLTWVNLLII